MENGFAETAPHKICQYIYELANAFNSFTTIQRSSLRKTRQ
ncbi:MAG: DALR anticodon-binding domain-containing protein [Clostridium sp.]